MSSALRIAYSFEPCWHRVPGGTALSLLRTARALERRADVSLVGFAARHRDEPAPLFVPPPPVAQLRIPRRLLYESWHRFGWPAVQSATGPVDVVHGTGGATPPRSAPLVVTVHDLAVMHHAEHFTANGRYFLRAALQAARERADVVLCPSAATLADCVDYGFEQRRLRIVPWGVDQIVADDSAVAAVRANHDLPPEFMLFVGTDEPRKNLATAVRAVRQNAELPPLVIAGPAGWGPSGIEDHDRIRPIGFVDQSELGALYRAASVFLYPSVLEGFGLPVLEAMAQGTPVVTGRGTATEELLTQGGGLAVDPLDPSAVADAALAVLGSRDEHSRLARSTAGRYTWDTTAELTSAAYREAAR